jgi:cytoskeletal protein CcmA (bactofilin family)
MFGKKHSDGSETKAQGEEGTRKFDAPPLKPFSKKGSHTPGQAAFRPEIPRRVVEIPGSPRRIDRGRPVDAENKKLIVGQDIHLSGEITSCDRLVVEGRVEASLTNARVIEVAPSGFFKGDAQVEEADISGRYEGTLIAYEKLTVRTGGRVSGSIRYGNIVIESGGEISGDMHALSQEEQAEAREAPETPDTPDTPDELPETSTVSPEKA